MLCNNWLKIALLDELEHISWGVFVNLPLIISNWKLLPIAIFFAYLIDIDHLIWVGSLSVKKMLDLGGRPAFHSIPAVVMFSFMVYIISKSTIITLVSVNSMASHLIWDLATGGVKLLYPWDKNFTISKRVSIIMFLVLFISALIITYS